MNANKLTDHELWRAIGLDDTRAFAALYNRYWKKLYSTVHYYIKDNDTAEQVVHDVFVVLWKRRNFLKIENFNNYLYITARYHVFKYLKAAETYPIQYIESYNEELQACANDAEAGINCDDLKKKLEPYLKQLPKRCREIFWLSRVENLSNDEIAVHFNISKRTIENQITVASRYLRHIYQRVLFLVVLFISQ